jgi:hypothetical protein
MNSRIRKKFLRDAERSVADACRLYVTRPRGGADAAKWDDLGRGLLSIGLALTLDQWAQHGPSRLRQTAVLEVSIESIQELPQRLQLTGTVLWSRRHAGKDTEFKERLRLDCPVPSLRKTPKATRPTILLEVVPPAPSN